MKLALSLSLFLFALLTLGDESFSASNYKIKTICKAERKKLNCIKNMKDKRSKLEKGNKIEIPVIPYK